MKKIIAALLTCTLAAAMLVGCGKAEDASTSGGDVNAEISTADDTDKPDEADAAADGTDTDGASTDTQPEIGRAHV